MCAGALAAVTPERSMITFALFTESAVMALGFAALADEHPDVHFLGSALPGQGLETLAAGRPDVIVVDHHRDGAHAIALCEAIGRRWPSVAMLIVSDVADERSVRAALEAGVRGYLSKSTDGAALVAAIRELAGGHGVLDPQVTRRVIEWAKHPRVDATTEELSDREIEILRLVSTGEPNKRIAKRLGVSENTVKTYLRRAYKKLGCNTRSAAAAALAQRGLI
jgi:DNA-binding NarL/FixJ family response regulator